LDTRVKQFREAYTLKELVEEFELIDLKRIGFMPKELNEVGFELKDLSVNFTVTEFVEDGYKLSEIAKINDDFFSK
jgi:hypothetical protein